jgi:acyl carrier protein
MSDHDHTPLLQRIVAEVTDHPVGPIGPDTRITDLGIDSVTFAEVVVQIEDTLDIDVPFARWLGVRTVREVLDMIDEATHEREGA